MSKGETTSRSQPNPYQPVIIADESIAESGASELGSTELGSTELGSTELGSTELAVSRRDTVTDSLYLAVIGVLIPPFLNLVSTLLLLNLPKPKSNEPSSSARIALACGINAVVFVLMIALLIVWLN